MIVRVHMKGEIRTLEFVTKIEVTPADDDEIRMEFIDGTMILKDARE
jgi:hypothetical protein